MPRIFLPIIHITNNEISITGEKARYLTSVLRCRKGDDLTVFSGGDECFRTRLIRADRKEVIASVLDKFDYNLESPLHIILAQSLLKGEKMDLVTQKATELGVREILPVVSSRSQLRETRKSGRWRKIAEEASRQSGRSVVPFVHEPVGFADIFSDQALPFSAGLIFYEETGMKLSNAAELLTRSAFSLKGGRLLVVIGPEGGFSGEEIELATAKGLLVVSLGRRILRAETAAISAVVLVQFLFGDMG